MTDTVPAIPPAAMGLPTGALEAAETGANRLDAWARTPQGRNFLAHALVQLARTGWLRTEPGEGFEPCPDGPPQEPQAVEECPGWPECPAPGSCPACTPMTRRTADSITDDELDTLYDELARLRGAAGDGPRDGLSAPLNAPHGPDGTQDPDGRDGASGGRTAAPDRVAAELRAQLADARKYAGQIEESLTAAYQCSNEAEAAVARVTTVRDTWRDYCIHWQTGWLLDEVSAALDGRPAPERSGCGHTPEHCRDAAALDRVRALAEEHIVGIDTALLLEALSPRKSWSGGYFDGRGRPTDWHGNPLGYAEMTAAGWDHCDACRTWIQATRDNPHDCPTYAYTTRVRQGRP